MPNWELVAHAAVLDPLLQTPKRIRQEGAQRRSRLTELTPARRCDVCEKHLLQPLALAQICCLSLASGWPSPGRDERQREYDDGRHGSLRNRMKEKSCVKFVLTLAYPPKIAESVR